VLEFFGAMLWIVISPIMCGAPCSMIVNDGWTLNTGTSLATNDLFPADNAQHVPQPPLSQSDLVPWHQPTGVYLAQSPLLVKADAASLS
jgi:hypothetical protein